MTVFRSVGRWMKEKPGDGCGQRGIWYDYELVEEAKKAIHLNYDEENHNHTVGSAIKCKSGKIYVGVNVFSLHGACAEQVAIGTAITHGERDFETIVAVRGKDGEEIIPPCGNCRQILYDYMAECEVILSVNGENKKIRAKELLPLQTVFKCWKSPGSQLPRGFF